jgi:hypothetical protein
MSKATPALRSPASGLLIIQSTAIETADIAIDVRTAVRVRDSLVRDVAAAAELSGSPSTVAIAEWKLYCRGDLAG